VFESADEFGETELSATLPQIFTPLVALSLLVFILLYVPCIATLATIKGEFGWKWALFTAIWQTGIAWLLAVVVYQGGRLLGYA
jgi:ferrous iron transport protein B